MCKKPFRVGVAEYGCGQCMPCRINRRRIWTLRLMLEAAQCRAQFVTLTYRDEFLPGELVPSHLTLYLKRLRFRIAPRKLRYYAVGEYGERRGRPHFHLVIYGDVSGEEIAECWGSNAVEVFDFERRYVAERVFMAGLGRVHIGELSVESAGYVASYTLKGMTKADDKRLGGRHPEFARMSLKPGIGAFAAPVIGAKLTSKEGVKYVASEHSVPPGLRVDGKVLPMGRYVRAKVGEEIGVVKQKYLRGEEPVRMYLVRRQEELSTVEGRELRERKRTVTALKAEGFYRRSLLKKGLAL